VCKPCVVSMRILSDSHAGSRGLSRILTQMSAGDSHEDECEDAHGDACGDAHGDACEDALASAQGMRSRLHRGCARVCTGDALASAQGMYAGMYAGMHAGMHAEDAR